MPITSIKGNQMPPSPIRKLVPFAEKAKKEGKRWKLIGCVEKKGNKVVGSVNPEMVELSHPLAGVMGAKNALTFTTDMLGDLTIIGPGAGKTETGFSILTDMLAIHRGC